jgi:hypothetical protein
MKKNQKDWLFYREGKIGRRAHDSLAKTLPIRIKLLTRKKLLQQSIRGETATG